MTAEKDERSMKPSETENSDPTGEFPSCGPGCGCKEPTDKAQIQKQAPFAATSIPCSFIGGYLSLPPNIYKPLVGIILLASACRLVFHTEHNALSVRQPSTPVALVIGAGLGLLSGLTGVGGGIFLSPLLLLFKWGRVREVSAVAALFILVNSSAGLLGHISSLQAIPQFAPLLAVAALTGGIIGSFFGSRRLPVAGIIKALSVVLTIAGFKLLLV